MRSGCAPTPRAAVAYCSTRRRRSGSAPTRCGSSSGTSCRTPGTPIFVQATLQFGYAILDAAGLSFIGLGVRLPTPEWGVMMSLGIERIISGHWWVSFFPGLAIAVAVMGFNLIGDGLRDLLDPRRR